MRIPARTIWDTKIQCICGVVAVQDGDVLELWGCGNYGQATSDPPRIIINPNRSYPIEGALRRRRRFSLSVFRADQREAAILLARARRRDPDKERRMGLEFVTDEESGIPRLRDCQQALLCEVERVLDTGDHTVMVSRVLKFDPAFSTDLPVPLLYPEISGAPSRYPKLEKAARTVMTMSGVKERVQRYVRRRRATPPTDIRRETYLDGGQTDEEIRVLDSAGLSDLGRVLTAPPKVGPPRRKVGVCVVGLGGWGSVHCQIFGSIDNVDLYVCARSPERVAHAQAAFGAVDGLIGLDAALQDERIEAVSLALPHNLHAEAACRALEAGKHVLVEKPIANTLAEAETMIESARAADRILMVAENAHFRSALSGALEAVDAGEIGEPHYFKVHAGGLLRPQGWKADPQLMGGGVLIDLGIHYVRAMRLLMGEPDRVLVTRGMQVNTKMRGEDSVQVLFHSRFGWQAHMLLSWVSPRGGSPDVIIAGDKGVLELWPSTPYYDLYPAAPRAVTRIIDYVRPHWLREKLNKPQLQRIRRKLASPDVTGYRGEALEFLNAIVEGRRPISAGADGRRDLEIVLKGYESLESEQWVKIPPIRPVAPAKDGPREPDGDSTDSSWPGRSED